MKKRINKLNNINIIKFIIIIIFNHFSSPNDITRDNSLFVSSIIKLSLLNSYS